MSAVLGNKIEKFIDREQWEEARSEILKDLKKQPDDHWLLTRLALTYYEQRRYKKALQVSQKAISLAPRCPLALWDYAGSLDMVHREKEAIEVWKSLLRRGVESVAFDECGEGLRWAESLLNDCRYRIGKSYLDLGNRRAAQKYLNEHLIHRRPGLPSSYALQQVRKEAKDLARRTNGAR